MTRAHRFLLSLLAATLAAPPVLAQDPTPLRPGAMQAGTLASDSRHSYTVDVADGTWVYGHVNQISVDVEVELVGPDGERMRGFDGLARGPEKFWFTSDTAGTFVIAVEPFEEGEGDYAIVLEVVEPVATDPSDRMDQLMTPYSGEDTPGVVVGVMDRGEVAFERAYGMADLAHALPYRVDTPTNIGSVTKQFTAMGILLLQNDGLLSLDDEVREHIPELPDFGQPVTLKNLLNHTGGFREIYNLVWMTGRDPEDVIRRDEAIQIVQRQPELQAQPNTEYNYNNTGFILLSMIVERLSGQTFPDFMRERVFEPLGMTDTRVKYYQGQIIPGASTPYVPAEEGLWRSARDLAASAGAGGIYTTWPDIRKWMLNYRDMKVGGPGAIELMTTRNVLANGDTTGYALGLGINTLRGQVRYSHTGGDVAHRTFFAYYPGLEAGVFMSSNNAEFAFPSMREIDELFFGDRLEPMVSDEDEDEAADGDAPMPLQRIEAIEGHWLLEIPKLQSEFTVEDGRLFAEPTGQNRIELTPTTDSTVVHEGLNVEIVFHFEADGSVDRATFTQGLRTPMVRFEPDPFGPEQMAMLAGRYYSRELELWLDVRLEDDGLRVHRYQADPIELKHDADLTFSGEFPLVQIEFQRAANGSITGLLAGNGRTKGVVFVRQ